MGQFQWSIFLAFSHLQYQNIQQQPAIRNNKPKSWKDALLHPWKMTDKHLRWLWGENEDVHSAASATSRSHPRNGKPNFCSSKQLLLVLHSLQAIPGINNLSNSWTVAVGLCHFYQWSNLEWDEMNFWSLLQWAVFASASLALGSVSILRPTAFLGGRVQGEVIQKKNN